MIPYIAIAVVSILAYTVAYLSTLNPKISLFANQEVIMRMRFARYSGHSRFESTIFSPISFLDFMVRRKYWIQCETTAISNEHEQYREHLASVEHVAAKGGLVLWDSKSVKVSFIRGALNDGDLCIFHEFTIVDDLDIAGTDVTDAGLENLKQLSDLRHLNVDNTRVTDEAIARFRLRMPNCFVWNGK